MKIDRIKIKNFKSIKEVDVKLGDINVLIGPNGAGKSNFITFFEMFSEYAKGNLKSYVTQRGGANKLLYLGRKISSQIQGVIEIGTDKYSFSYTPNEEDNLDFSLNNATDELIPFRTLNGEIKKFLWKNSRWNTHRTTFRVNHHEKKMPLFQ